jgi:hypothetical protein
LAVAAAPAPGGEYAGVPAVAGGEYGEVLLGLEVKELGGTELGVPKDDVGLFTAALANAFGVCFAAGDSG